MYALTQEPLLGVDSYVCSRIPRNVMKSTVRGCLAVKDILA